MEGEHVDTEIADNNLSDKDENEEPEDRIIINQRHSPISMVAGRHSCVLLNRPKSNSCLETRPTTAICSF